jgi:hypothetical protein
MKMQSLALVSFLTLFQPFSAFAHANCETPLTSPEVRTFQAIQSSYQGTRIPVLVEKRSRAGKSLDSRISARFYAVQDWESDDLVAIVKSIVSAARPATSYQSFNDLRIDRPVRKGELVNIAIQLSEPANREVFEVRVIAYNAEEVPLFSANELIY